MRGVSKFHRRSFQNKHFVPELLQIFQKKLPKRAFHMRLPTLSQKKLPKWAFRARRPRNFAAWSFQNERFIRGEASSKFHRKRFPKWSFRARHHPNFTEKLPKWSFRPRLPPYFKEEASKMIVSCEASSKLHRKSFQNDRFVHGFFHISKKKLPKWSFRATRPPNFTAKVSKMIVSSAAPSKFDSKSFQNDPFVRGVL